jgi:hypothetical protein
VIALLQSGDTMPPGRPVLGDATARLARGPGRTGAWTSHWTDLVRKVGGEGALQCCRAVLAVEEVAELRAR